jgi:RNA polymerase sigma-70 factor, ECF subfamily
MEDKAATFLEYRNLLFSIAYSMLGEVDTAHDLVQDAFVSWMEAGTDAVRYPKAFLVRILTNSCINYLGSGRIRREQYVGVWLPEPLTEYSADKTHAKIESYHALSIGLMVLLEKLTPRERAVFLLKEIFTYDYYELAELFGITAENARQLLKRAKDHLGQAGRRFEVDIRAHERMLHNFLRAVTEGSLEDLISLLKEDIVLLAEGSGQSILVNGQRLTAVARPIEGRKNVGKLISSVMPKFFRDLPDFDWDIILVNGAPAILSRSGGSPFGLVSIESDGELISNIYIQTNPEKLKHFHLPK